MTNKENREPKNSQSFRIGQMDSKFDYGSDDDTDDAEETAAIVEEERLCEMRDLIYRDKSEQLRKERKQLEDHTHPIYVKGVEVLKEEFSQRQFKNEICYAFEVARIMREHEIEREAAYNEFNQKEKELKENLIASLEERKKIIEFENDTMDINNDTLDVIPNPVRKLRRRGRDPSPVPEPKRRKISPIVQQLKVLASEEEINEDLSKIYEDPSKMYEDPSKMYEDPSKMNEVSLDRPSNLSEDSEDSSSETKICETKTCETRNYENWIFSDIRVENGKLYYEKYWYHRGQQIYYEEDGNKISAVICIINLVEVWVKRTSDNEKRQISISDLIKGVITLKRRSA